MAITYPLTYPTHTGVASVNLFAKNSIGLVQSPFTFNQQVFKNQGQGWEADVSLPPMKRADAEIWISFFVKLYGSFGTFLFYDPNATTPQGTASSNAGTPVVNGIIPQTGNELAIDGLPTSETGYLKAGDYIQLGTGLTSRLHKVLDDVDTNGSGEATLTIYPDIISAPADGDAIVVSSAQGLFRLSTPTTDWNINREGFYSITFGAISVI